MTDPKAELARALALENETERKLAVVAVIDAEMQRIGFRAVVIGGVAVGFWTRGAYSTGDIDLYLPHGPAVLQLLGPLGFERHGRHYVLPGENVFVEAPGPSFPAETEEVDEVTLRSGFVVPVAEQAVALLGAEELDRDHLRARVREERLQLAQRLESGDQVESWELHEIARGLRSPRRRLRYTRRIGWDEWEAGRKAAEKRLARIARGFPRPYRRERPRDPDEAQLLRERGTPEALIGPDQKGRGPRVGPNRTTKSAARAAEADAQGPVRDRPGT